jgi:hypothetical protein
VRKLTDGSIEAVDNSAGPTDTLDEVHASIDLLNRPGEACKKAGLVLALHNDGAGHWLGRQGTS